VTDWTQVKPGTKVRYGDNQATVGIFHGLNRNGRPIIEDHFGEPYVRTPHVWEPIPTTYTLTLTGPTGDSESVEVEAATIKRWAFNVGSVLFGEVTGLCADLLAREGEDQ